jgi:hypothetical protein
MLNDGLAPPDNRFMAISSKAKANALGLRQFTDASFNGSTQGLIKGEIGEKLGAFWFMDQNLTRHTAGTATAGYLVNNGAGYAIGIKTVTIDGGALGTILSGDKISFSGHEQTYVLTADGTGGSTVTSISFEPGLQVAIVDNEPITVRASHRQNMLFHRDALALASRPFAASDPMGLGHYLSAVDPVSGLALRLEVTRQHKRTRWSYDILCGVGAPRPGFGAIVAGE